MWFGVTPSTNIIKACVLKRIGLRAQNMIPIMSIDDIIEGPYMTTQRAQES